MEWKILIVFLFISLPLTVRSQKTPERFARQVNILNELANNKTKIANDALLLMENGFLGEGAIGFVYGGQLVQNDRPIAIKFISNTSRSVAENEFLIYQQMCAYQNPQVENFGIPAVYYYGEWNDFILITITKFDESLDDILKTKLILPLDIMILFKNFVIQSRYMHWHGVCHGDPHSKNIMFRSHRSFLIDFGESRIMTQENAFTETHEDWISFMFTIMEIYDLGYVLDDWTKYKDEIKYHIADKGLVHIIKEFGDEAFQTIGSEYYPDYDRLQILIHKEITKKQVYGTWSLPKFSWLQLK